MQAAEHQFDVVGHPRAGFQYAIVFAFHPAVPADGSGGSSSGGDAPGAAAGQGGGGSREAERSRFCGEYQQGPGEMQFVLPSGAFDPRRHRSPLDGAQAELHEEVTSSWLAPLMISLYAQYNFVIRAEC